MKVETSYSKSSLLIVMNDGEVEIVHKFAIIEEDKRLLAIDWVTERSFASSMVKSKMAITAAVMAKLGKQYSEEYYKEQREAEREVEEYQEAIKNGTNRIDKAIEF